MSDTPSPASAKIDAIMRTAPVIPVLVIDDLADALPLAQALVAGGLRVLEVTLRTPCALDAIRAMKQVPGAIVGAGTVLNPDDLADALPLAQALVAGGLRVLEVTLRTPCALDAIRAMKQVPGAIVGAGTVLNPDDLAAAIDAGSEFIVSPGLTPRLGEAAVSAGIPFLPGTANAADIMLGMDLGLSRFKFFPAEASGGVNALKAIAGPFGAARFCPTGGITLATAPNYLALPQVLCIGGSWMVPKGADAATITAAASAAAALKA